MTTSQTLANFESEVPTKGDLAFACVRNQHQAHDLLVRAVDASGFTQKELAKRSGIDEATLSRVLSLPRNVEINTLSKIVYAACGATLTLSLAHPSAQRNMVVLSVSEHIVTNESTDARMFLSVRVRDQETHDTTIPRLAASTDQYALDAFTLPAPSKTYVREVAANA